MGSTDHNLGHWNTWKDLGAQLAVVDFIRRGRFAVPLVGDNAGHDLVGAGPDGGEPDVAVDALQGQYACITDGGSKMVLSI